MKKLILALIALTPLSTIPIMFQNLTNNQNNNENNISKNLDNSKLKYNPTFPSFKVNLYITANAHTGVRTSGGQVNPVEVYSNWEKIVNVLDYAPDKSTFTKNYSTFKVEYDVSNYHDEYGKINHGWYREKFYQTINTNFSSQSFQTKEYGYHNYHDTSSLSWYEFRWNGNYIEGRVHAKAWGYVHKSTRGGIEVKDEPIIFSATFNSSYNINSLKNKIKTTLNQPFTITSDTSSEFASTEKNGKLGTSLSNRELIENEVDRRLRVGFGDEYNAWFSSANGSILKLNPNFSSKNGKLPITLKDQAKISGNEQFVTNVEMPIKVNLSDLYWEKSAQQRLKINPGSIINPNSVENKLMIDNPEYDPKTNTFIYHNSVSISFSAKTQKEILLVNGNEVPVYDNNYSINLDDDRVGSINKGNEYTIKVNGVETSNGLTDLQLNIKINSLSKDLNYKWLGWNPNLYPEQKKLISKYNDDGTVNDSYDPNISEETGMRNQYIFVQENNLKYPFFIDPLDKWGNIIKESDNDKNERIINGYIAEASVANSGVTLLKEFDKNSVYKVDRMQLDPTNLSILKTEPNININMNEQFSKPGLWHYAIYLKDYVSKKIEPSNPGTSPVTATSGSTIHKFIYISNNQENYTYFTNLNEIRNNSKITEFFSSIPGKHLKNYLINYTEVNSTEKMNELSYEELILYWKKYVSDQFQQKVNVPDEQVNYKNLENLEIASLVMNEINPVNIIKKIEEHVKKSLIQNKFSEKIKYNLDYFITNEESKMLKDIDFTDFINIKESPKNMNLIIKANSTSTLLIGQQSFTIFNNKDYEENKVLDLGLVNINDVKYNFTDSNEEVKLNFIENYIKKYVVQILELYRPTDATWDYIYGEDYFISISGLYGKDIETDSNFKNTINNFLNSDKTSELEITIVSYPGNIKLTNYAKYKIINEPESENIAPVIPPSPNPVPTDPDGENDVENGNNNNNGNNDKDKDGLSSTTKSLIWVFSLIIPIFSLILFLIWKRQIKKRKKIK